jgi:hypothetical protein
MDLYHPEKAVYRPEMVGTGKKRLCTAQKRLGPEKNGRDRQKKAGTDKK